jgi:23S rRNA-/tRNA-specific pseudouridylate synthase
VGLPPKIFEDDSFIAFDKPAGMPVGGRVGLMQLVQEQGMRGVVNVHRLEEEASGLVLCAKDKTALDYLSGQFQSKTVTRKYLAIVQIRTEPPVLADHFAMELSMGPDEARPGFVRAYGRRENGKASRTEFSVRTPFCGYALLECRPETSQLHQLRFHLAQHGAPVVGETAYVEPPAQLLLSALKRGYKGRDEEKPLVGRLALHASELTFRHPVTREPVTLAAPFPHEFEVALKYLTKFGGARPGALKPPSKSWPERG